MEDAINQISGIMNLFPNICNISIANKNSITVYYSSDIGQQRKIFTNAIDLLDWCEGNLINKPDSKLTSVIKYFKELI